MTDYWNQGWDDDERLRGWIMVTVTQSREFQLSFCSRHWHLYFCEFCNNIYERFAEINEATHFRYLLLDAIEDIPVTPDMMLRTRQ